MYGNLWGHSLWHRDETDKLIETIFEEVMKLKLLYYKYSINLMQYFTQNKGIHFIGLLVCGYVYNI